MRKKLSLGIIFLLVMVLCIPNLVNAVSEYKKVRIDVLEGTNHDGYKSVVALQNGGYAVVGETFSSELATNGSRDAIITIYDKDRNIVAQKVYGSSSWDSFEDVAVLSDGNLVAVGSSIVDNGYEDGIIVKYNTNGEILWERVYGAEVQDYLTKVIPTSDGGCIVAGHASSPTLVNLGGYNTILVKYSSDGTKVWETYYDPAEVEVNGVIENCIENQVIAIAEKSNGELVVLIECTDRSRQFGKRVVTYSSNGELISEKDLDIDSYESHITDLVLLENGDLIIVGSEMSYEMNFNRLNFIYKFDSNGEKIWKKSLQFDEKESQAYSILKTIDGNFLIFNIVKFEDGGNQLVVLASVDSEGEMLSYVTCEEEREISNIGKLVELIDGNFVGVGQLAYIQETGADAFVVEFAKKVVIDDSSNENGEDEETTTNPDDTEDSPEPGDDDNSTQPGEDDEVNKPGDEDETIKPDDNNETTIPDDKDNVTNPDDNKENGDKEQGNTTSSDVPQTGDNVIVYVLSGMISLLILAILGKQYIVNKK